MNPYAYAGNNPANAIDFDGRWAWLVHLGNRFGPIASRYWSRARPFIRRFGTRLTSPLSRPSTYPVANRAASGISNSSRWFLHRFVNINTGRYPTALAPRTATYGDISLIVPRQTFTHISNMGQGDCRIFADAFIRQHGGILGRLEGGQYLNHYFVLYRRRVWDPTLRNNVMSWIQQARDRTMTHRYSRRVMNLVESALQNMHNQIPEGQIWYSPRNHQQLVNYLNRVNRIMSQ